MRKFIERPKTIFPLVQPDLMSTGQPSNHWKNFTTLVCFVQVMCEHRPLCTYQCHQKHQKLNNSIRQTTNPLNGGTTFITLSLLLFFPLLIFVHKKGCQHFFHMYLTLYCSPLRCHYQQNNKTTTNSVNPALNHTRYKTDMQREEGSCFGKRHFLLSDWILRP